MDLRLGERLKNLSGDTVWVQQKLPRPGPTPVYNLEVQDEHVYYVGASGVLAHNAGKTYGGSLSGQTFSQAKKTLTSAAELHKDSTRLGHALSKHAGRKPHIWGKITGGQSSYYAQAMKHLREIYRAPGKFQRVTNSKGITFLEKKLPDGRGIRLQLDHGFKGFID